MPKQTLDKTVKKALADARKMIEDVARADGNEAETRRRIERIFESIMGYDTLKHISREHAVHGVGDTEYCDFAIQLSCDGSAIPEMLVEIKRVGIDLASKHLKQAASYAINKGCEWVLLTNGREWKLYHISFGQPPQHKLIDSWNIIEDTPAALTRKFNIISYKSLKKNSLKILWEKSNVLTPPNVLKTMLSEEALRLFQRGIKKQTGVNVSPEDMVGAIRRLLNELAINEMDKVKISLPERKQLKKAAKPKVPKAQVEESVVNIASEGMDN